MKKKQGTLTKRLGWAEKLHKSGPYLMFLCEHHADNIMSNM